MITQKLIEKTNQELQGSGITVIDVMERILKHPRSTLQLKTLRIKLYEEPYDKTWIALINADPSKFVQNVIDYVKKYFNMVWYYENENEHWYWKTDRMETSAKNDSIPPNQRY